MNKKGDFTLNDICWLNCSHQGPLPKAAIQAAHKALEMKADPSKLDNALFFDVPHRLKEQLGQLVNVAPHEIILGNSASYFVHLLAQGLPLDKGDTVLTVQGDFPTNIVGWKPLLKKGVNLTSIKPSGNFLQVSDLEKINVRKAKVLCVSWINSFDGYAIDLAELYRFCQDHNIIFCVNVSQALGYKPIDLRQAPVDVLFGCGFKWLLGPYGTGVGWIRPDIRARMNYAKPYWLHQATPNLGSYQKIGNLSFSQGRSMDVFGTANFLNFMSWTESVAYLNEVGVQNIESHNLNLVRHLLNHLPVDKYDILSPGLEEDLSSLAILRPKNEDAVQLIEKLKDEHVFVAMREGNIRVSPHVYNTLSDIDRLLEVL